MTTHTLDTASKLRLRQRFNRWMKSPGVFAGEIADAQKQIELAEQPGWSMSIDRAGIPTALPPRNLRLSPQELSRFRKRLQKLDDPEEIKHGMAALSACAHRGFKASVDSEGRLVATAPKSKVKAYVTDHAEGVRKHQSLTRKFFGSSAFK